MKPMIKTSTGWSISRVVMIAVFAFTLTACGGGGGGGSKPVQTLLQQIKALIATGTPTSLEAANDLLLNNQDNLSAADFEALMDALIEA